MLKLSKQTRDEMVAYLSSVIVPSQVGFNLTLIAQQLSKLEEIVDTPEEKK